MTKKFLKKSGKKKSGNHTNFSKKELSILKELLIRREGLRAETINKLTGIPSRTIYRKLNILIKKGLVYNEYPLWKIVNGQVKFCHSLLRNDNIFELHNVGYVVRLLNVPKWWHTRKNRLLRLKGYQFKSVDWGKKASNPYIQLKNDKFVIQTYPESIIIIHRKRYYSNDPYEIAMQFLQDFYDLWEWFEERMKFKFFEDGVPQMTLRGNHFNRLNDWIANKIKEEGSRFLVELDKNRKVWVDYSEPFGKEANYPTGQETLEKHTKDLLLKKPMLNSELQLAIQNVTQNQVMFDRNFQSHLKILKKLSIAVDDLRKEIKNLNKAKGL